MTNPEVFSHKVLPFDLITQQYTPDQQEMLGDFLSSPLSRLVMDIEVAKDGVKKTDYGHGRRNISAALTNRESATRAVRRNQEFKGMFTPDYSASLDEEQQHFLEFSGAAYADLLTGDDPKTKMLALTEPFRTYVKSYHEDGNVPGPYFNKILSTLSNGKSSLAIINSYPYQLTKFDEQYFWLAKRIKLDGHDDWSRGNQTEQEAYNHWFNNSASQTTVAYKDACDRAFVKFSTTSGNLLNLVFDDNDKSEWRQFVVDNFDAVSWLTSLRFSVLEYYNPQEKLDRMKRLFDGAPSDEVREALATYVIYSEANGLSKDKEKMDDGILNGDPQKAYDFVDFWHTVSSSKPSYFSYGELFAYEHWLDQYMNGEIGGDALKNKIPSTIHSISEILQKKSFTDIQTRELEKMTKSDVVVNTQASVLNDLIDNDIFPTTKIAYFATNNGVDELMRLKAEIERGNFDPNDAVQKDLEYMKYLATLKPEEDKKASYQAFSEIPFDPEYGRITEIITPTDRMEAQAAALEAARVYWTIKERVDMGKNVLVVGNERYGKLFVVDPLKPELDELGVKVVSSYVRSGAGHQQYDQVFDDETLSYVAKETPDIIVVDGTKSAKDKKGNARFSRAMRGFYNWTKIFNAAAEGFDPEDSADYNPTIPRDEKYWNLRNKIGALQPTSSYALRFMSAYSTDTIILGDMPPVKVLKPDEATPQIIIVNSTTEPKQIKDFPAELSKHQAAYFDDPEGKMDTTFIKEGLVFTKNGLEKISGGQKVSVQRFTAAIQHEIRMAIPEMIMSRASNPYS